MRNRLTITTALVATALLSAVASTSAQIPTTDSAQQPAQPAQKLNPGECGAAGRGCATDREQEYMHLGYKLLPQASSSAIANYAHACATKPAWRNDCEKNPSVILQRLGLTTED
ncbi:hypothetical protein [Phyllobacterium zundukense]|uniref:3',5'-cyclic-nucleotide phosphodiesterase n=1 Tax=Phyllobacterium zundukense TaxID=1867719 RepID=A0A2N9W013_9HYPH|nr:hypothetical protein [Phyllobacterium zundukense]ATU94445.1 hypothetical protein BLM14_22205 [Phyllobacterium zundukense]PIO45081.1 hypothetical protein B5P45_09790 [Phyllobacterium zundukense]